jgi:hypothetical protein
MARGLDTDFGEGSLGLSSPYACSNAAEAEIKSLTCERDEGSVANHRE